MTWTDPTIRSAGDVIDAAIWNTDLVDNLEHLYDSVYPISDTLLTSDTASIDITSIPATFKHLMVCGSLRTDRAGVSTDAIIMRINNNSTADDYAGQSLSATAAAATAAEYVADHTSMFVANATGATATAGYFGTFTMFINDYANANKMPSFISTGIVFTGTATGDITVATYTGFLDVAGAVSRLTFLPSLGSNLADKSRITLYGMR